MFNSTGSNQDSQQQTQSQTHSYNIPEPNWIPQAPIMNGDGNITINSTNPISYHFYYYTNTAQPQPYFTPYSQPQQYPYTYNITELQQADEWISGLMDLASVADQQPQQKMSKEKYQSSYAKPLGEKYSTDFYREIVESMIKNLSLIEVNWLFERNPGNSKKIPVAFKIFSLNIWNEEFPSIHKFDAIIAHVLDNGSQNLLLQQCAKDKRNFISFYLYQFRVDQSCQGNVLTSKGIDQVVIPVVLNAIEAQPALLTQQDSEGNTCIFYASRAGLLNEKFIEGISKYKNENGEQLWNPNLKNKKGQNIVEFTKETIEKIKSRSNSKGQSKSKSQLKQLKRAQELVEIATAAFNKAVKQQEGMSQDMDFSRSIIPEEQASTTSTTTTSTTTTTTTQITTTDITATENTKTASSNPLSHIPLKKRYRDDKESSTDSDSESVLQSQKKRKLDKKGTSLSFPSSENYEKHSVSDVEGFNSSNKVVKQQEEISQDMDFSDYTSDVDNTTSTSTTTTTTITTTEITETKSSRPLSSLPIKKRHRNDTVKSVDSEDAQPNKRQKLEGEKSSSEDPSSVEVVDIQPTKGQEQDKEERPSSELPTKETKLIEIVLNEEEYMDEGDKSEEKPSEDKIGNAPTSNELNPSSLNTDLDSVENSGDVPPSPIYSSTLLDVDNQIINGQEQEEDEKSLSEDPSSVEVVDIQPTKGQEPNEENRLSSELSSKDYDDDDESFELDFKSLGLDLHAITNARLNSLNSNANNHSRNASLSTIYNTLTLGMPVIPTAELRIEQIEGAYKQISSSQQNVQQNARM